jgi:hypothetical protein
MMLSNVLTGFMCFGAGWEKGRHQGHAIGHDYAEDRFEDQAISAGVAEYDSSDGEFRFKTPLQIAKGLLANIERNDEEDDENYG